jgi:hypothetical protein
MVFVPLPPASALGLRDGQPLRSVRGFAATPSLRASLGPDVGEEEADYAALDAAGLAALDGLERPRRLVLAAEVDPAQVRDGRSALGEVELGEVWWRQVQSFFADEPDAAPAVAAAVAAASGVPLEQVLELPAVAELGERHDLLWYAVEELDDLR